MPGSVRGGSGGPEGVDICGSSARGSGEQADGVMWSIIEPAIKSAM